MKIRIATRKSNLALWQARWVAERLRSVDPGVEVEEVHIMSKGDKVLDKPLASIGGKGLFISAVEAAVVRGEADLAVHSLKDVPGDIELAEGMVLGAYLERENPRDGLLSKDGIDVDALPEGACVGTTSLRRTAQLLVRRPDLVCETLRGNVETRLSKLDAGEYDAIVLAAAGLHRLGLLDQRAHVAMAPEDSLPAVGQGTVAIEVAEGRDDLARYLDALDHRPTRLRSLAERALLKTLAGSCRVPIAGYATLDRDAMTLRAFVGALRDGRALTETRTANVGNDEQASALGREVGEALRSAGADEAMREAEAVVLEAEREAESRGGRLRIGERR